MESHVGLGRRWRRFLRKKRGFLLLAFLVITILGMVVLLMIILTSSNWRTRW